MEIMHKGMWTGRRVLYLSVDAIRANPDQPRKYFEPEALRELAESIRRYGILQPLFESFRIAGRNMSDSSMFGAISLEMTLNFISGLPAGAKEAINQKLIQIRKK